MALACLATSISRGYGEWRAESLEREREYARQLTSESGLLSRGRGQRYWLRLKQDFTELYPFKTRCLPCLAIQNDRISLNAFPSLLAFPCLYRRPDFPACPRPYIVV